MYLYYKLDDSIAMEKFLVEEVIVEFGLYAMPRTYKNESAGAPSNINPDSMKLHYFYMIKQRFLYKRWGQYDWFLPV